MAKGRTNMAVKKWIDFGEPYKSASGKTQIWYVQSADDYYLGNISWYGRWRKYAFRPGPCTIFEQDCLRELADFCEAESKKLRQQWQKRRG